MIKGILFDYGGTIDTNGLHWGVVLWNSYQQHQVVIEQELFAKAYAFGERALAINPLVKPEHNFLEVLRIKVNQQFDFLAGQGYTPDRHKIDLIAHDCYQFARSIVSENKAVIEILASEYPLVMVSNFYGNLKTVLEDFGIRSYFKAVVESAVVGVRKPDAAIYRQGVQELGFKPDECLVVGDSYTKDIVPAHQAGCRSAWLNVQGWDSPDKEDSSLADVQIKKVADLPELLNSGSL
ncbi:putative hydrolase of the HAD superfamily [bacterium A37T11]|nr:putative hydrolase of the HAD superfamily [bacterium A37T11]